MRAASPQRLLTIMAVSLAMVAAHGAFAQQDDPEEPVQAMPKEGDISLPSSKGELPPKIKTVPSVKATPIEIPDKRKPVMKKKPSVEATPIEIPDKRKPVIKEKPSVEATPIEIPDKR